VYVGSTVPANTGKAEVSPADVTESPRSVSPSGRADPAVLVARLRRHAGPARPITA